MDYYISPILWLLLLLLMSFRTVAVSHLMPKFPLCSVQDVFSIFLCKRFELVRHDTPQSVVNTTTQYMDSTPAILHPVFARSFRCHPVYWRTDGQFYKIETDMGRQIRKSKGKTMKPNFFVFCEGESEVAYISHLRSQYRAPIQIIPRKSDSNISVRYIENCKREYVVISRYVLCVVYINCADSLLLNKPIIYSTSFICSCVSISSTNKILLFLTISRIVSIILNKRCVPSDSSVKKLKGTSGHCITIRMVVVHWYFLVMKQRDPIKRISMNSARWFAALNSE